MISAPASVVLNRVNLPADAYRQWREQGGAALAFREGRRDGAPPERLLQEIWAHQRLRRDALATTHGRRVSVLHPGFWNREAGPDFLRAVIQIEDEDPVSGDIEIDVHSSGWRTHGHGHNAAYKDVILHVVWEPPPGDVPLATLTLRDVLDAPLGELETWVGGAGDPPAEWLEGQCSGPLRRLTPEVLRHLLEQAALIRLHTKGYLMRARARAAGWEQALWEGLFRALGYKHNSWPMQRLAEMLPMLHAQPLPDGDPRHHWEARLLGLGGLLPPEPRAGSYARRLWDSWWRERGAFPGRGLPPSLWRLHGVRPVNHPHRRIALAAAWLSDPGWTSRLADWFLSAHETDAASRTLPEALRARTSDYWRRHCTLTSTPTLDPLPVLGGGRINDMAVNVLLPWFWARAQAGGDSAMMARVEAHYLRWPAGEDNAVLKLARSRLLGEARAPGRTAAIQQGLLQIVRDFCAHSNSLCEHCAFPRCVDRVAGGGGGLIAAG